MAETLKCAGCGRPSVADHTPFLWARTDDGFHARHPTCGHGKYLLCPDCDRVPDLWRCPQCHCRTEYT